MELPRELEETADLRGREYAWPPRDFPVVLSRAEALGLACLGGQFQFRLPDAVCEMYWLNADSADRAQHESWAAFVTRSCAEVLSTFTALVSSTDFLAEAKRWHDLPALSVPSAAPEQYICFVAYFVSENAEPN